MFNNFEQDTALSIYTKIAGQSRIPFFFNEVKVSDSFESRLEILSLNLILVMWALKNKNLSIISQQILNLFFQDLDNSLRELGVSDLSVGRKIKVLAENFYGRLASYNESIDDFINSKKKIKLSKTIKKNFEHTKIDNKKTDKLVFYAVKNIENFKKINEKSLKDNSFEFKN